MEIEKKRKNANVNLKPWRRKRRSDYTAIKLQDISAAILEIKFRAFGFPFQRIGTRAPLTRAALSMHEGNYMIFAKLNFTEVEAYSILVELRSILRKTRSCVCSRARAHAHATRSARYLSVYYSMHEVYTRKFPSAIDSAYKVEVICMEIYVPRLPILWFRLARDLTRVYTRNGRLITMIDHRDDDSGSKVAFESYRMDRKLSVYLVTVSADIGHTNCAKVFAVKV